jgi:hypothetical protein
MDATQADAFYDLVTKGFAELGGADPKGINRSLLLRGSCYAGQVFRWDGWRAVWLIGGETVEFYDAAGKLVRSASLAAQGERKAA